MTNSIIYYRNLEIVLRTLDIYINILERKKTDEYDQNENYSNMLTKLYAVKRIVERMLSAHKFYRLTKIEFAMKLDGKFEGNVIIEHVIKDYETPQSIAKQYGITLEQLLKNNNEITTNFEPGSTLKIEVDHLNLHSVYSDVPVFGSQVDRNIFGVDLTNDLKNDGRKDLHTIKYEDCLRQGIINRVTTEIGGYPLIEDFGLYNIVGTEFPPDLRDAMMSIKLIYQLEGDPRIDTIDRIGITTKENSVIYDVDMTSINKIKVVY